MSSMGPRSPKTGPWPGTMVCAPSGATTVSSTSMAPATEPMSRNGVPPLKIRSPQNSTDRSGIQMIESLVVCAAVPTCRTCARRSPACSAISSVNVTNGGSRWRSPQSGPSQNGSSRGGPNAMASSRARSCATMAAPRNRQLPKVWSPWWWVLTTARTGAGVTAAIASR